MFLTTSSVAPHAVVKARGGRTHRSWAHTLVVVSPNELNDHLRTIRGADDHGGPCVPVATAPTGKWTPPALVVDSPEREEPEAESSSGKIEQGPAATVAFMATVAT